MLNFVKRLTSVPLLGRSVMIAYRCMTGLRYAKNPAKHFVSWLFTSREFTNYTYALTDTNKRYLAEFVSHVTGIARTEAQGYLKA